MLLAQDMPLLDVRLEALLTHSYLAAQTEAFLAQQRLCVPASSPALCVLQGEQALLGRSRGNAPAAMQQLGSQDATTCVIAVLRCRETHVCWAAHFDSLPAQRTIKDMQQALATMTAPSLYLVGGYADVKGAGPRLAQGLLLLFYSSTALGSPAPPIHLELACVGTANTAADGSPCSCALVVDVQHGTAHPWTFACRGPELPRRMAARHCCRRPSVLLPVWDERRQLLVLAGFDPTLPSWYVMEMELRLRMTDAELLACTSTSPLHEPTWFAEDFRGMMLWLVVMQSCAEVEQLKYWWDAEAGCWSAVVQQQQQQAEATMIRPLPAW